MNASDDSPRTSHSVAQQLLAGMLRRSLAMLFKPLTHPRISVAFQRRWMTLMAQSTRQAKGVSKDTLTLGGVPCQRQASASQQGTVLYLHGGGYVAGSPASHKAITSHLASFSDSQVVVPDYRLAPEHPSPAALDDALAVYQALLDQGESPDNLTLMGDSAGGGLVLATLQALKQQRLALPASAIVFSPWVDLTLNQLHETNRDPLLRPDWLASAAEAYAGDDLDNPVGSPINGDLSGLPPLLIQVGADEILLNDSHRLHQGLKDAGGEVTLQVHPQRWHDFQLHAGVLKDADQALVTCARFIHRFRASH